MKLLAYTDATSFGGAETVVGHLLAELDPGIEVVVVGIDGAVVDDVADRRAGCERQVLRPARGKWDLARIAAHVRAVRRHDPDIVHVNLQSPWAGQYGIIAGAIARRPVVAVEQIVFPSNSPLKRMLRRWLHRRLAAHVGVGERVAREIEGLLGLEAASLEVIHNGVPDQTLSPVSLPGTGPVVGALARLEPQKGLDTMVRSLALLPESVSCVIVGDGPERRGLEDLAAELDVGHRLTITGWSKRARDYLPSFDVVALPSRFEGFPLVVLEAMMARRPVVATAVQSVPEAMEDGETGFLIPIDDPPSLARAMTRLIDDPDLCTSMGERARARALEHFTAARMARSYEALYARLVPSTRSTAIR
jgi:glycosyltransferase involved in cell wall biosynthesis